MFLARTDGHRVTYEGAIGGLKKGEWVKVKTPLPKEKSFKDSVTLILFYIPTKRTPKGRYSFLLGRFEQLPPPGPRRTKEVKLTLLQKTDFSEAPGWLILRARREAESLLADTRGRGGVWHEFLHSDPERLPLQEEEAYIVKLRYRIIAPATGYFYFLARHKGKLELDQGWTVWSGPEGEEGIVSVKVGPLPVGGYRIILGIRGEGAICVEDLSIWRLP